MKKFIVILGVIAVSFSSIFVLMSSASGFVMAFYRMAFSAIAMIPIALIKDFGVIKKMTGKEWLLSVLSGVFLGAHFALYFTSLSYTSVTACTCLIDMEAVFVPVIMSVFFRARQGFKRWIAIAVALGGALVLTFSRSGAEGFGMLGNILALLAGLSVSVYTVLGNICRRDISTAVYTAIVYTSASVTALIACLCTGESIFDVTGGDILAGLALAGVCTLLGHSVFSWGLKYESPVFISTVKLLEPVFATALAVIIIKGERLPGLQTFIGAALVIAGTVFYSLCREKSRHK